MNVIRQKKKLLIKDEDANNLDDTIEIRLDIKPKNCSSSSALARTLNLSATHGTVSVVNDLIFYRF